MLALNYGYWEFWAPYNPSEGVYGYQSTIFDGINKLILIDPAASEISVREDIYSNWKEWTQVRDNSKFDPAIRTTGGDPVGGGEFSGDIYFLINGWRLLLSSSATINGVLFSDDFPSPYIQQPGTSLVTNRVSALVQTVTVGGSFNGTSAEDIWNYANRTLTSPNAPTAREISDEIWRQEILDMLNTMTPEAVWGAILNSDMQPGSAGDKLKQVLTTGNFIALK